MCIDGYFITLQIPELTECAKLLRYTSNNVNQIARRVNSGGGVYSDEVDEIIAIPTRWSIPPENWRIFLLAASSNPTRCSRRSIRSSASRRGIERGWPDGIDRQEE
ncbi:MAG: MobC family plasmid mobilization relaxosome protein [Oscillospiraceae bacterium]|nr:MobC family plasmid mobilization relaxosome protein [Oscillospiraceae bacterium]